MADLAVLVTVPLDQLEVAVLPAGPLDFGLLDEHVATTLRTRSDGAIAHTDPQLPQHHSATRPPRTRAHQRPASQSPRATRPQTRKMGLALTVEVLVETSNHGRPLGSLSASRRQP